MVDEKNMSKLYFRYGAMNSGKTTALLQVAHNYEEQNQEVLILKPAIDSKGSNHVCSRLGISREVDALITPDIDLFDFARMLIKDIDCILVDEAQFLTREQVRELFKLVSIHDIPVICYGLRTDFKQQGFPAAEELLLIAHDIEEMKTICTCGRKATLNIRVKDGEVIKEGPTILIDSVDTTDDVVYKAICSSCYYKNK